MHCLGPPSTDVSSACADPEPGQPSASSAFQTATFGVVVPGFHQARPAATSNPGFFIRLSGLGLRHTQVCVTLSQLGVLPVQSRSVAHCTHAPAKHRPNPPLQLVLSAAGGLEHIFAV